MKNIVICKLPRAGLGNQLFPLFEALIFAEINKLPIKITGYNRIKIGPYLRREKTKRNYSNYFNFEKNILLEILDRFIIKYYLKMYFNVSHPELKKLECDSKNKIAYVFHRVPDCEDYFYRLRPYRNKVKTIMERILNSSIKSLSDQCNNLELGVHIRMGDFRKSLSADESKNVGTVRTPEEYFYNTIQLIVNGSISESKISLFTDGYKHEFNNLFTLNNIEMVEGNPDIVDLLLLSKSKIIITSSHSTFSYWAGFLSDSPIILHPNHKNGRIRALSDGLFEGTIQQFIGNI